MATDVQENVRKLVLRAVEDAAGRLSSGTGNKSGGPPFANKSGGKLFGNKSGRPLFDSESEASLSGIKGVAAGAAAAVAAPALVKGAGKLVKSLGAEGLGGLVKSPGEMLGKSVSGAVSSKLTDKVEEAGGPAGIVKDAAKSVLPFGGGGDDNEDESIPGVGEGRRMPVQQSVDIGAPVETVYNQWTQFELWPNFMHRVTRVTQEDDCTLSFAAKIWGRTKEFTAKIETQRPNERIKWRVTDGITHTGVVTFHELGPRLTRVLLALDVDPGGMLEKAARGMRHIKRAARGDLHRFKAFIEMHEQETGAWRGVIENGELVKKHSSSYDKQHEYAEPDDVFPDSDGKASSGRRSGRNRGGGSGGTRSASRSRSSQGSRSHSGNRGSRSTKRR